MFARTYGLRSLLIVIAVLSLLTGLGVQVPRCLRKQLLLHLFERIRADDGTAVAYDSDENYAEPMRRACAGEVETMYEEFLEEVLERVRDREESFHLRFDLIEILGRRKSSLAKWSAPVLWDVWSSEDEEMTLRVAACNSFPSVADTAVMRLFDVKTEEGKRRRAALERLGAREGAAADGVAARRLSGGARELLNEINRASRGP